MSDYIQGTTNQGHLSCLAALFDIRVRQGRLLGAETAIRRVAEDEPELLCQQLKKVSW